MAYTSKSFLFKSLTDREEKKFREWAQKNYRPGDPIPETWHPVVREECMRILDRQPKPESIQ